MPVGVGQLRRRPRHYATAVTAAELGRNAETAVADCLFAEGFSILGRNIRLGSLELDIVARKGSLLAVVEVRARRPGALVGAFASVTSTKRARLLRAVQRLWREHLSSLPGIERVRIDVAAVTFVGRQTRIEYAKGALGA
jgi:putative endonuclease